MILKVNYTCLEWWMDQNPDIHKISSFPLDKDDYKEEQVIWVEMQSFHFMHASLAIIG